MYALFREKLLTGVSVKNFHPCVLSSVSGPTYFHSLLTNECLWSTAQGTRATKALF